MIDSENESHHPLYSATSRIVNNVKLSNKKFPFISSRNSLTLSPRNLAANLTKKNSEKEETKSDGDDD